MTWANSIGGFSHNTGGHYNEPFIAEDGVSGVLLHHKTAKDNPPVTFAVAACETQNVNVTVLPVFGLSGENHVSAKEMWNTMAQNGHFNQENFSAGSSMPSSPGQKLCVLLCLLWLGPHLK